MTTDTLRLRTRRYLGDSGAWSSSSKRTYDKADLDRTLTVCREKLILYLHEAPRPGYLAIMRLAKKAPGTDGAGVPDDFWFLDAVVLSDASSSFCA